MAASKADSFFNLYNHGFVRTAVCVPELRVSDVPFNTHKTIELAQKAARQKAVLAIFPELGLSAYSNDDLFHQDALLKSVEKAATSIHIEKPLTTVTESGVNSRPVIGTSSLVSSLRNCCRNLFELVWRQSEQHVFPGILPHSVHFHWAFVHPYRQQWLKHRTVMNR